MDLKKIYIALVGVHKKKLENATSVESFLRSLYTAARCRYLASTRLKNKGKFSFLVTTLLSLGLIFIPLMQNAGINISFPPKVLNMIQIFLAVSVLVYSIINSKSRYEVRSEKLSDCGDKIKRLARELSSEIEKDVDKKLFDYQYYREKYYDIETDFENHSLLDYSMAILQMPEYYSITGLTRLYQNVKIKGQVFSSYSVSGIVLIFELLVIIDMLNIFNCLSKLFI